MTQSPSINDLHYEKLSDAIKQFDPTDGSPLVYIGQNSNPDALDTDLNWVIRKIYYSGSNITKVIKRRGAWSDRVALFP
jgi:hypothetical protein